jgi:hypothetical protein
MKKTAMARKSYGGFNFGAPAPAIPAFGGNAFGARQNMNQL